MTAPLLGTRAWPAAAPGGTALVCVSGLGGSASDWAAVATALTRHGDVVAVDLRLSAARGNPLVAAAAELSGMIETTGATRTVVIGHSLGALVSLLLAGDRDDWPAALVLASPFAPVARNGRSVLTTVADYAWHRAHFVAEAPRRRRGRGRAARPGDGPRARLSALRALAAYGLRPAAFHAMADRVRCPVLLVHGASDHHVPPAFAAGAAARHRAWDLSLIAGAGHFPHRDDPVAWLAAVEPWLLRLPR